MSEHHHHDHHRRRRTAPEPSGEASAPAEKRNYELVFEDGLAPNAAGTASSRKTSRTPSAPSRSPGAASPRPASAARTPLSRTEPLPRVRAELSRFRESTGAAIGEAYAIVARAVLNRIERMEDESAARRLRRRAQPPSRGADAARCEPAPTPVLLPFNPRGHSS
jgi:hypothetical protein